MAWWYGAIVVGFVVADISPLPAVLLWIGIWVALAMASAIVGNPWPSFSPFRTTFAALEWFARRLGVERLDAGLLYPTALGRWPAIVLLAGGIWCELILPARLVATTVAALMTGYTLLTLAGMALFGPVAWLRNAELFEVLLGWLGRIGPIARRSVSRELCTGCSEACSPSRCIDCPECAAAAADDGERRAELRAWFVGLTEPAPLGWSDVVFIVLVLAGVTYDGMNETAFGGALLRALQPPIIEVLGATGLAFLLTDTAVLALVIAAFLAAFGLTLGLTRDRRSWTGATGRVCLDPAADRRRLPDRPLPDRGHPRRHLASSAARRSAHEPRAGRQLDPGRGHLVPERCRHRRRPHRRHRTRPSARPSRRARPRHPRWPAKVALMIGYTVLSLWIIAQPIVVDPGVTPSAIR